ncbi:hypothetical protein Bpro_2083 [Polaromonas sp. JS666]|nr:hypothetical protein Bpro_2083 [Polaromonas sp. JS666]
MTVNPVCNFADPSVLHLAAVSWNGHHKLLFYSKKNSPATQSPKSRARPNTVQLSPCLWFVIPDLIRDPWIAGQARNDKSTFLSFRLRVNNLTEQYWG